MNASIVRRRGSIWNPTLSTTATGSRGTRADCRRGKAAGGFSAAFRPLFVRVLPGFRPLSAAVAELPDAPHD
jgi:hypothetical protein